MNQLSGVKKKDELIFIQKTLKKITNQDLDMKYIEKNYLKILFKLKSKKKNYDCRISRIWKIIAIKIN